MLAVAGAVHRGQRVVVGLGITLDHDAFDTNHKTSHWGPYSPFSKGLTHSRSLVNV